MLPVLNGNESSKLIGNFSSGNWDPFFQYLKLFFRNKSGGPNHDFDLREMKREREMWALKNSRVTMKPMFAYAETRELGLIATNNYFSIMD